MANICSFSMAIVGSKENIETFNNWLNQNGTTWIGRGAETTIDTIVENEGKYRAILSGWCKWSIQSALINNAISMRTEPERWSGHGYDSKGNKLKFVTLYEACEELGLDMEVYSEEPGCEFQEHILFRNGWLEADECIDYSEEYDEESGEYICTGGFEDWYFDI